MMRETTTGTGGMSLLQILKDARVEYLFTNPYLIDLSVARERVGVDSTWHRDWRL